MLKEEFRSSSIKVQLVRMERVFRIKLMFISVFVYIFVNTASVLILVEYISYFKKYKRCNNWYREGRQLRLILNISNFVAPDLVVIHSPISSFRHPFSGSWNLARCPRLQSIFLFLFSIFYFFITIFMSFLDVLLCAHFISSFLYHCFSSFFFCGRGSKFL